MWVFTGSLNKKQLLFRGQEGKGSKRRRHYVPFGNGFDGINGSQIDSAISQLSKTLLAIFKHQFMRLT